MSILIKGMKIPERCSECDFLWYSQINQTGKCGVNEALFDGYMKARSPNCPMSELPHHGRLIDADALKEKQMYDADLFKGAHGLMEKARRDEALNAVANIVNAPTIIPAEEGE